MEITGAILLIKRESKQPAIQFHCFVDHSIGIVICYRVVTLTLLVSPTLISSVLDCCYCVLLRLLLLLSLLDDCFCERWLVARIPSVLSCISQVIQLVVNLVKNIFSSFFGWWLWCQTSDIILPTATWPSSSVLVT